MHMSIVLAILLTTVAPAVFAHGTGQDQKPARTASPQTVEEKPFGRAGDPKKATRTIRIEGRDTMRYTPSAITVKQGETVRFVVKNAGKMLHETVLGTKEELDEHYALMKKFPDMEHDEPHMVHLKPGETGEMFWRFTRAGEFYFACLIPGHYEAGMVGTIRVVAK